MEQKILIEGWKNFKGLCHIRMSVVQYQLLDNTHPPLKL